MTQPEIDAMVEALRAEGWTCEPPADARIADPWEPGHGGTSHRRWRGSTSLAAYAGPESCTRCCHHCSCAPRFAYWTRLFGDRSRCGADGYANTLEEAQGKADEALLQKLREARERRTSGTRPVDPSGPLSL